MNMELEIDGKRFVIDRVGTKVIPMFELKIDDLTIILDEDQITQLVEMLRDPSPCNNPDVIEDDTQYIEVCQEPKYTRLWFWWMNTKDAVLKLDDNERKQLIEILGKWLRE